MRVRIHTASASYTLTDSPETIVQSNLRYNGQRVVQVAQFLRGTNVKAFGRGNRQFTLAFEGTRTHASVLEAGLFVLDHDGEIPLSGLVELVLHDGAEEAVRWIPDAAIVGVNLIRQRGVMTRWDYSLVAGQVLKANPNT